MPNVQRVAAADLKDAFLNEVRKSKKFFYGTVVAQAQRIDIDGDRVVFTFAPQHHALRDQLDQTKTWLDTLASQLSGRKMTVVSAEGTRTAKSPAPSPAAKRRHARSDRQTDLRQQALADSGVQAMLDVFAAEIKDVEEGNNVASSCQLPAASSVASEGSERRTRERANASEPRAANRDQDHIMNIQQMMKQAQQMQDKLQKQMAEMRVEATAGGGMVTVVVNGAKQVLSLKIDPEAVSKEDVEMLQDLILAAINDAHRKADEEMQKQMGGMMGGLKIPGMF